jgi:ATP synthase protein I
MSDRDGKPDRSPADDAELAARLHALERRLDQRRTEDRATARRDVEGPRQGKGMALALRLAADFVAGVILGAALGWGFDRLFGTSPWGLMVFLLLGFAAGILSVMRSAGLLRPGPTGPDDRSERG